MGLNGRWLGLGANGELEIFQQPMVNRWYYSFVIVGFAGCIKILKWDRSVVGRRNLDGGGKRDFATFGRRCSRSSGM